MKYSILLKQASEGQLDQIDVNKRFNTALNQQTPNWFTKWVQPFFASGTDRYKDSISGAQASINDTRNMQMQYAQWLKNRQAQQPTMQTQTALAAK